MDTYKQSTLDWIDSLDPTCYYELREEVRNGDCITHKASAERAVFTHEELMTYVYNIWLDSHPPELIICRASAP